MTGALAPFSNLVEYRGIVVYKGTEVHLKQTLIFINRNVFLMLQKGEYNKKSK
jgi:hypothetical protein